MIRASALYLAIVISLIIVLFSGFLIQHAYLARIQFNRYQISHELQLNASSGMNLLLSANSNVGSNEQMVIDLFSANSDSVYLQRKTWGGLEVLVSRSMKNGEEFSKVALTGTALSNNPQDQALYLANSKKPLSLCGNTMLRGTCYLPEAGVKRAYIEGQSFRGKKLINGATQKSKEVIPEVNKNLLEHNRKFLEGNFPEGDSIVFLDEEMIIPDDLYHSFLQRTLIYYTSGNLEINNKLSGNIVISAGGLVNISSSSRLENVIIYAGGITVRDGFYGAVQLFASDSLVIDKHVELIYPSLAGIIGKKGPAIPSRLTIKDEAVVNGAVFNYSTENGTIPARLEIGKGAQITGQVYSNGIVDIKGDVYGSLTCSRLLLKTPSSVYENHLLNVTIDRTALPDVYAGMDLLNEASEKKVIEWLRISKSINEMEL